MLENFIQDHTKNNSYFCIKILKIIFFYVFEIKISLKLQNIVNYFVGR